MWGYLLRAPNIWGFVVRYLQCTEEYHLAFSDFGRRIQSQFCRMVHHRMISRQQSELSLGITLVAISILFIVCQSVKLVPDLYELFCPYEVTSQSTSGNVTCHSTKLIDTFIRYIFYALFFSMYDAPTYISKYLLTRLLIDNWGESIGKF